MEKNDYYNRIKVSVPVKEAFKKITEVSKWWSQSFKGRSQKTGDTFSVSFGETFVDFRVGEVIPDKKIVWDVTDCNLHWIENKKEWKDTKIVWEVYPDKGKTKVGMTHVGLVPQAECFNDCKTGWNFYIEKSLFKLLTGSVGLPDQG